MGADDLNAARAAKDKVKGLLPKAAKVAGVGLTQRNGKYVVKVNLQSKTTVSLPSEVDGVPIVFDIVGEIHKQH